MKIIVQEKYEDVLAAHWHKLHQIKQLVDSDNGSELRARSISDRRKELSLIVSRKNAIEYVFDDCELIEPEWYKDLYSRLRKYEDPFYRHQPTKTPWLSISETRR